MSERTKTPAASTGAWSSGPRLWIKRLFIVLGTAFALFLALFAFAYARTDIPDPNQGFESQTTYVYYADGKDVLGKFADQDRTSVKLSDVPQHVQDAIIAAEDRTFWTNKGIDPKGILRAAFNNAKGGDTQGASTITQQYVKVYYLSQERTFTRKAKEAILSLKIQRQLSKEEILEGYLNTIYFGRGAYGIEAASRAYFDRPAKQLSVRQGAALAAIVNSPNGYDPAQGQASKDALAARYGYVIDGMNEMGTLPSTGKADPYTLPKFPKIKESSQNGGQRGHVLTMVKNALVKLGYSDSEIYSGGLRVTTTFTRKAMAAAEAGVLAERPDLKGLHVAAASVEPETGALRGMYGGQDYLKSQINWAVAGGAPGSTFKPFSLATALEYGYSLKSTFNGNSPIDINGTEFNNQGEGAGRSYGSAISLLSATQDSVNTAYVDLVNSMDGGIREVIDTAVAMGIPRKAPGLDENFSMVLGSATISPIDMANAYGTIVDEGKAKKWYVIERVKDSDGRTQYKHRVRTEQAISADVAADTSYALEQVTTSGTGTNANVIGREIAGKTGTATTDGGNVRSSWFVGYTPQLATAVMYSRGNGNQPLNGFLDTFYGGEHPARTWAGIMAPALEGEPEVPLPEPVFLDQTAEGHEPLPTYTPEPSPTSEPTEDDKNKGKGNGGGNGGGQAPTPSAPAPSEPPPSQSAPPTPGPTTGGSPTPDGRPAPGSGDKTTAPRRKPSP